MSEAEPTPEQLAACERAMAGLEAQADLWADEVSLAVMVKNIMLIRLTHTNAQSYYI